MKTYEVLLMDVDGTLLDFDRAEEEAFHKLLLHFGFSPNRELVREYHKINQECWEAFEDGRMGRDEVLTSRFERFFKIHGKKVDGREAEEHYRIWLSQGFFLIEGAIEILRYLEKRYILYVVTNGVASTQHIRMQESGLRAYFKDVFISEEVGSQKPQKEFFEYCFSQIPRANPDTMLLIGDSLTSDIRGGKNASVDTCWYNPHRKEQEKGIVPTYEIQDLAELKKLL